MNSRENKYPKLSRIMMLLEKKNIYKEIAINNLDCFNVPRLRPKGRTTCLTLFISSRTGETLFTIVRLGFTKFNIE